MKVLPSTSVIVALLGASAANTGRCTWSGAATAARSRSRSSPRPRARESRCGCRSSCVTATARSVPSAARRYARAVDAARDLDPDPLAQFEALVRRGRAQAGVVHPEAMALATATRGRRPVGAHGAAQGIRRRAGFASTRTTRAGRPTSSRPTRARRSRFHWRSRSTVRCASRGRVEPLDGGGVARVLRHAAAGQPARRLGLAAVPTASPAAPSSNGGYAETEARFAGIEDLRCRRSGAATASSRRRSSSGRAAPNRLHDRVALRARADGRLARGSGSAP